jgi:hypothetical protein
MHFKIGSKRMQNFRIEAKPGNKAMQGLRSLTQDIELKGEKNEFSTNFIT